MILRSYKKNKLMFAHTSKNSILNVGRGPARENRFFCIGRLGARFGVKNRFENYLNSGSNSGPDCDVFFFELRTKILED